MEPFVCHTGRAVALRRSDIDTDQIIPSDWLKRVERTGFGAGLFSAWREDPDFALNAPSAQGASILLVGRNFGTGSSREHAVWALQDFGFRAVISESFADIFRSNALKGGLLPVQLTAEEVEQLFQLVTSEPASELTIDLENREVRTGDVRMSFPLDDFTAWRLLQGLDDIGLTLRHEQDITAYEQVRVSSATVTGTEPRSPRMMRHEP